jgi:hypothetical protein
MSVGSSNGAAPLPSNINLTKAKVIRKKDDWTWEDEVTCTLFYMTYKIITILQAQANTLHKGTESIGSDISNKLL